MNYKTYISTLALSKYIKCYWTLEVPKENEPQKQRIVPDGCMEMIFHYGDFYKQYLENGKSIVQPKCFVFGQVTQPLEIEPMGETGIFAIRFFPDGFTSFSAKPISEMENRAVPLQELYGKDGLQLEKEILNALTVEERIKIIENFFLKKIKYIK